MDRNKTKNPYSPVISSSEISQYLFCPLSWWFDRTGEKIVTKSMELGAEFHAKQAEKQTASREKQDTCILLTRKATLQKQRCREAEEKRKDNYFLLL